ncbi:D-alanyl-D-alanine endopeptidase [Massilia soli]|uniref:D-alanyl-D-alanine endopeptidase n=1 Tax=Massilia soli TaxID=2792854 RepID=A0ABS7ST44_9BURK|nr:D-alanyl-D-alanine endopeptidase [Massilia soli]MBZ2209116.1 D-alanyl-D-alanine endopeptidase [Massilia soli]
MFKFALSAFISLLFALTPAEAAKVEQRSSSATVSKQKAKKSAAKKQRYKRKEAASKRVNVSTRGKAVRRVITVRGKRKVVYQSATYAAPVVRAMTAGDKAGLNLTRDPLDLSSSVALVLDQTNSEVLFEKNAGVALPIASITKLMTGLIVVEAQQDMDETLTVTDDDVDREKFTTSRLRVGSRLTRREMLHIALMSSENRAAAALGRNYPGGIQGFVAAMNAKAHELGMSDTRYVDSSGLSSRNVASARDLAKLVMAAHQQPLLREFSTDPASSVAASGRQVQYRNTNYLVSSPDWDIGLQKTGFINEAGRCLVMQTIIQGRAVIMVFLDSKGKQSRTADAGRMRRWLEALKPPGLS